MQPVGQEWQPGHCDVHSMVQQGWSRLIPFKVECSLAAAALGSISINLARAIGPAVAGVLIAQVGVGAVFAVNTATFLVFGLVVAAWRPAAGARPEFPERFISAVQAGAQALGALLAGFIAGTVGVGPTLFHCGRSPGRRSASHAAMAADRHSGHGPQHGRVLAGTSPRGRGRTGERPGGRHAYVQHCSWRTSNASLGAMQLVPLSRLPRLRTGATQWGLFRDGEAPRRFVEIFFVPSWEEHLRQHSTRLTETDRQYEEQVEALSNPAPKVSHFIGVDVRS